MKKFISVLLCVCLIVASCLVVSSAQTNVDGEISDLPVIMVAGYGSTALYTGDSPETGKQVWGVVAGDIISSVLSNIAKVGISLGALAFGNTTPIAETVGKVMVDLYGVLACAPDGTSVNDIHLYSSSPEKLNTANAMRSGDDILIHEKDIEKEIAEYVGYDNIYTFQMDFRMGQEACAKQLDEFIDAVIEYTGKDKVNLYAVSHGGQTAATYLVLYGYKNKVNNAVLTVPAIGGAGLAYDPMANKLDFDEECLARFIEHGTMTETDVEWLLKANRLGFLDDILNTLLPYLLEIVGNWGSMWDFIPVEKYEEVKALRLDPVKNAGVIAKSDRYHYEIQPLIKEKFAECEANGTHISIIAGTGNPIVTGLKENSDGVITTHASTGAACAPYGQRFADGYVQINDCGGKYKVSPSMTVDASTAYLPDNTWFVEGLFHGMTLWDYYTIDLAMTLLLTDRIKDVYTDEKYPQFKYTTNPSSSVYAEFSNSEPGFIGRDASSVIITNVNRKNPVIITGIVADGAKLRFKMNPAFLLMPGESTAIKFEGEIPSESGKAVHITVCYASTTLSPLGYRTQTFTVSDGDRAAYEGGFRRTDNVTPFDTLIGDNFSALLQRLGLKEFFSMIYSVCYFWFNAIFG